MPTPTEYQATAIAALTASSNEAPSGASVETPPGASDEAASKAPSSGDPAVDAAEKELAAKKAAEASIESVETPKPPPELAQGFNALAREKAALRKREVEITAQVGKAAPMLKAAESKDALGLLAAAGLTYTDVVRQLTGGAKPPAAAAAPEDNPLAQELRELKQMMLQERAQQQQQRLQGVAGEILKSNAARYKYLGSPGAEKVLGGSPSAIALKYLENYQSETGEMPGATWEQSIQMALEALEAEMESNAKNWIALTNGKAPATVSAATKEAVHQATSDQAAQSKTLTNSLVAPVKPGDPDEPRTEEEYRRKALALFAGR